MTSFEHFSFSLICCKTQLIVLFLGLNIKGTEANHASNFGSFWTIDGATQTLKKCSGKKWIEHLSWVKEAWKREGHIKTVAIREEDEEHN
jgi:hypothetical protein